MKEETKGILIVAVIFIITMSIFGYFFIGAITDNWCKSGVVTDKYILPNVGGYPKYYLVLNNQTDTEVSENSYYKYNIGDEYKPCN